VALPHRTFLWNVSFSFSWLLRGLVERQALEVAVKLAFYLLERWMVMRRMKEETLGTRH
jgi:hypothetical protein